MEDQDSILDALDKIKDWAMSRMVKSGETPPQEDESAESPEMEAGEHDGEGADEPMDEMPIEEEAPKSSVLKRYDFTGGSSKPKDEPAPFKRGRGRPPKIR